MRIICVNTGNKFDSWYTRNLKHMIDTYSGLKYDEFVVISSENYKGVFNKLQMFDLYRDGENLYFDLDIVVLLFVVIFFSNFHFLNPPSRTLTRFGLCPK